MMGLTTTRSCSFQRRRRSGALIRNRSNMANWLVFAFIFLLMENFSVQAFVAYLPQYTQNVVSHDPPILAEVPNCLTRGRETPDSSLTALFGVRSFVGNAFRRIRSRRRRIKQEEFTVEMSNSDTTIYQEVSSPPLPLFADAVEHTEFAASTTRSPSTPVPSFGNLSEYGGDSAVAYAGYVPSFSRRAPSSQLFGEESSPAVAVASAPETTVTLETAPSSTVTVEKLNLEKPLYDLVPVNRTLTNLEQEFRSMLESFASYSHRDILSLRDERVRVLFEGVAASAHEPAVYRAFEVLFEDLYPLRIASRVIYKKLLHLMEDSKAQRQKDVDIVVQATGLDPQEVEATWLLFVSTASKINRDAHLTQEQLVETGFLDQVKGLVNEQPLELLLDTLSKTKKGHITFTDFIIGLHTAVSQECSVERQCDPLLVLETIVHSIGTLEVASIDDISPSKKQHGQRYDDMLESFKHWQHLVPDTRGRRMDVVRGCFMGADNEKVVRALRICYTDFSGLRMAAEIIFKLVKAIMNTRERAAAKSNTSS